jgi:hypothetical protein
MASDAQIRANQINAQKSTGPRTDQGKMNSRMNAITHGLTASTVLPEREAAESQRRFGAYCQKYNPVDEVEFAITLRAATLSTRMERCVEYETAMLTDRVRQAEADFVPPEGVDEATAKKLRSEAGKRALFDDSKAAILARKYEAAAERGFFRCIKELDRRQKARDAAEAAEDREFGTAEGRASVDELGSILQDDPSDAEFDRLYAQIMAPSETPKTSLERLEEMVNLRKSLDVPIPIGKRQ